MALTDQPYLPLYVDDWMNNNKLKTCSPGAHGLMISIMCIMHKEESYGKLLLKQKFKQNSKQKSKQSSQQSTEQIKNFACQLAKLCAFDLLEIEMLLTELLDEKVLEIDGDFLICKRMVRDAEISTVRRKAGEGGGKKSSTKKSEKNKTFAIAKVQANAVNGIVIENENVITNDIEEKEKGGVEEKENTVLETFKDFYQEFILQKTQAKPKWDGEQVKAAKSIIAYLKTLPTVSDDEQLLYAWRVILKQWHKLDDYQKKKIKLTEINSDIIKIIDQIKNFKPNNGNAGPVRKTLESTLKVTESRSFGEL
jgi:hypothetical protein